MRFMMFMLPNIPADGEWMPSAEAVAAMSKYNRSCRRPACCWRSTACTRRPRACGSRSRAGSSTVTDGPFTEAKEMIGGYWMIEVKSKEEAVEWASRCPQTGGRDRAAPDLRDARSSRPTCRPRPATALVRPDPAPLVANLDPHRSIDAVWRIESAAAHRRARAARCATSGSPKSSPRTRSSRRLSSGPSRASRTTRAPGSWPPPSTRAIDAAAPAGDARAQVRASSPVELEAPAPSGLRSELDAARRRRRRRRPAAARVHRVPSGAVDRGARRAHAAAARRPDDRRDRARVPRARADRSRSASCAPSARCRRPTCRSRCRPAPTSRRGSRRCSRSSISSSTRATPRPPATTGCGPALCEDALRLGRILAELLPDEPEVHGLVALMEIQASRTGGAGRARRASRCCCSNRTAPAGTGC